MTDNYSRLDEAAGSRIRYWPFVSTFLEGDASAQDCQDVVGLFVYEVGFGMTWEVGEQADRTRNPGWDLQEARVKLGGEEPAIEADGCVYRFSLEAWRRVPHDAWRVLPIVFRRGEASQARDYFMRWATLDELRGRARGDQIVVSDPKGRAHTLSLRPWSNMSGSLTRLSIRFAEDDGRRLGWRRRLFRRLIFDGVERERARGLDPSPRHFNPSKG